MNSSNSFQALARSLIHTVYIVAKVLPEVLQNKFPEVPCFTSSALITADGPGSENYRERQNGVTDNCVFRPSSSLELGNHLPVDVAMRKKNNPTPFHGEGMCTQ